MTPEQLSRVNSVVSANLAATRQAVMTTATALIEVSRILAELDAIDAMNSLSNLDMQSEVCYNRDDSPNSYDGYSS